MGNFNFIPKVIDADDIRQRVIWINKKDMWSIAKVFDGAKFRYVVDTWCAMLVETMEEVGIFEDMQVSVMKQFRDKMSQNETQIRRETQKIDSAKAGK